MSTTCFITWRATGRSAKALSRNTVGKTGKSDVTNRPIPLQSLALQRDDNITSVGVGSIIRCYSSARRSNDVVSRNQYQPSPKKNYNYNASLLSFHHPYHREERRQHHERHHQQQPQRRWFVSITRPALGGKNEDSELIYERPFRHLVTRIKVVSISTAGMSLFGLPLGLVLFGSESMSLTKQLMMCGFAIFTSCGSTVVLHLIFSPYVHTIRKIPMQLSCSSSSNSSSDNVDNNEEMTNSNRNGDDEKKHLLTATTRNFFGLKKDTIFDPYTEIYPYKGLRPFCNFMAKDEPLYVHPEQIPHEAFVKLLSTNEKKTRGDPDDDTLF